MALPLAARHAVLRRANVSRVVAVRLSCERGREGIQTGSPTKRRETPVALLPCRRRYDSLTTRAAGGEEEKNEKEAASIPTQTSTGREEGGGETMASFDENGRKYTPTKKAYKNEGFINSSQVTK